MIKSSETVIDESDKANEVRLSATKRALEQIMEETDVEREARLKKLEQTSAMSINLETRSIELNVLKERLVAIRWEIAEAEAALQLPQRVVLVEPASFPQ